MNDPAQPAARPSALPAESSLPLGGQSVAVVGAGTMGRGIAQLLLQAGATVTLIDPSEEALAGATRDLESTLRMLESKRRLAEPPAALLGRLRTHTRPDGAAEATWAIEAAPERLELKRSLFADLAAAAPEARLATNTSTLSVTSIAAGCGRPQDVIGIHFFNPAPLMRLVEVIPGVETRPDLVDQAVELARALGRTPVVAQDRPGFIVNRVARPYYGEALRLAGEGVPIEDIDASLRAAGFRMGPFELLDLIGLDVNLAATICVYEAFFHEPRYRPHPLQRAMVEAARLGRKSGRGFYRYDDDAPEEERPGAVATGSVAADGEPSGAVAAARAPNSQPRLFVIGDGVVAETLRARLPQADRPEAADLVLDARVDLDVKRARPPRRDDGGADVPGLSATLCWAHSASAAAGAVGGANGMTTATSTAVNATSDAATDAAAGGANAVESTVGFSLLPGASLPDEPITIELMAPVTASGARLREVADVLRAAGARVVVLPDHAGGAAFRIVGLLVNEATSALAEGLATAEDIDTAMELGVNYPSGPLAWAEALGLPDVWTALRGLHLETGAERFAPHPLLAKLVAAGGRAFADVTASGAGLRRAPGGGGHEGAAADDRATRRSR